MHVCALPILALSPSLSLSISMSPSLFLFRTTYLSIYHCCLCWTKHLKSHRHWIPNFVVLLAWGCLREHQNWVFWLRFYFRDRCISFRLAYTCIIKDLRTIDPLRRGKKKTKTNKKKHPYTNIPNLYDDRFSCNTGSGAI